MRSSVAAPVLPRGPRLSRAATDRQAAQSGASKLAQGLAVKSAKDILLSASTAHLQHCVERISRRIPGQPRIDVPYSRATRMTTNFCSNSPAVSLRTDICELSEDVSSSGYYSADLAPVPRARRKWGVRDLAVLWICMSACIPTYMLASSLIDEGMNWWQAVLDDLSGQLHRARADDSERPCRHAIRHSVSGLLPGLVRHPGANVPAHVAGPGGLRLVRHPDLDRRHGDLQDPGHLVSGVARLSADRLSWISTPPQLVCFLAFWAVEHVRDLPGHRFDPHPAEHQGAALDRAGAAAAGLGLSSGGRFRADALAALAIRSWPAQGGAVLGILFSRADRHGRLLGHAFAQHPRFQPLRPFAARSGAGASARPAADDGLYSFIGVAVTSRDDRDLRQADLGPGAVADPISPTPSC